MRLLVALALVGHAVMHVGAVSCTLLFVSDPPSIVSATGVGFDAIKVVAIVLTSVTVTGYLLAALAGTGVLVPRAWWRPAVFVASIASAILLVGLFSAAAVPGLLIDGALLWAAAASWQPGANPAGQDARRLAVH